MSLSVRSDIDALSSPESPVYPILGRGFAGVLNCLTLPKSRRGSRVCFIGRPDPWEAYSDIAMGQWPVLLHLPGFDFRPGFRQGNRFHCSKAFSRLTRLQCHHLDAAVVEGI